MELLSSEEGLCCLEVAHLLVNVLLPQFYSILNVVVSVVWSVMTHWFCVYSRCAVLTVGEGVRTSPVFILE